MYEKLRTHILPHLIPPNAKVMVAVSGGPDSMALSHLLWRYTQDEPSRGVSLVLTHVHHGVRKESDEEALMVQEVANQWKVPCVIHRFNAKGYAKAMGQSFQEAAREWRYARWNEDMSKLGCTLLATAHHLGDQAETILYRLLRGSGTAGLAGIYPAKDSIIRPLLTFSKEDIINYCAEESLPYALDASNAEPVYIRNKIRLMLLPELERDYNPRIQEALGRTGVLLRWDEEYMQQRVDGAWEDYCLKDSEGRIGLRLDVFGEPEAILSRLLRKAAMLVNREPRGLNFNYIFKMMESQGRIGWSQDLPGLNVKITEEGIWFRGADSAESKFGKVVLKPELFEIPLKIGLWANITGIKTEIGLWEESSLPFLKLEANVSANQIAGFDEEILRLPVQLVCRTRIQGDKMWFRGIGHKSLKKIFQEERIAVEHRDSLPLIAFGSEVLWIPGVRQSDLYRPENNNQKVYCILRTSEQC